MCEHISRIKKSHIGRDNELKNMMASQCRYSFPFIREDDFAMAVLVEVHPRDRVTAILHNIDDNSLPTTSQCTKKKYFIEENWPG